MRGMDVMDVMERYTGSVGPAQVLVLSGGAADGSVQARTAPAPVDR